MFAIYHTFCNESINVDIKTFSEIRTLIRCAPRLVVL